MKSDSLDSRSNQIARYRFKKIRLPTLIRIFRITLSFVRVYSATITSLRKIVVLRIRMKSNPDVNWKIKIWILLRNLLQLHRSQMLNSLYLRSNINRRILLQPEEADRRQATINYRICIRWPLNDFGRQKSRLYRKKRTVQTFWAAMRILANFISEIV